MSRLALAGATSVVTPDRAIDPATYPIVQPEGFASGWNLTLSEEFGAADQDAGYERVRFRPGGPIWSTRYPDYLYTDFAQNAHTGNPQIPEQQFYTREAVSTGAGMLHLTVTRLPVAPILNPHPGFRYSSGQINLQPSHNQTFGYFEARMRLPGGLVQWPAFWMFPQTYTVAGVELDIMECYESSTEVANTNQMTGRTVNNVITGVVVTNFHTYGLKWTSTQVTWYVDGIQTAQENNAAAVPQVPMFVILNLACKPRAAASEYPERIVTDVDYVRSWQAV